MDPAAKIQRRIEKIKRELAELGDMRPGSLSVQKRSWGGRYYQLSYTHQGRGHTQYVPRQQLQEIRSQVANYRKFRRLTQEWVALSLQLSALNTPHNILP